MGREHSGRRRALSAAARSWNAPAMDESAWPYEVEPFQCHRCWESLWG